MRYRAAQRKRIANICFLRAGGRYIAYKNSRLRISARKLMAG